MKYLCFQKDPCSRLTVLLFLASTHVEQCPGRYGGAGIEECTAVSLPSLHTFVASWV